VSAQMIGFYESETHEPSWTTWVKMAKALMMEPGALAFGSRERESERVALDADAQEKGA
jgi:DNA-binding XRE family transcriptional regulator